MGCGGGVFRFPRRLKKCILAFRVRANGQSFRRHAPLCLQLTLLPGRTSASMTIHDPLLTLASRDLQTIQTQHELFSLTTQRLFSNFQSLSTADAATTTAATRLPLLLRLPLPPLPLVLLIVPLRCCCCASATTAAVVPMISAGTTCCIIYQFESFPCSYTAD